MTTLTVVVEELLARTGTGRYTEELTRELILAAPRGVTVEAFVAASTEDEYARIRDALPGLARLHKSALAQRELRSAWQHGFTRIPGSGMLHAPSLLAPLTRHDRVNDGTQTVVTLHDLVAWTHPDSLTARQVSWNKGMLKRAERYADAIVVPTHSVADRIGEYARFGDRVRVIGGAPSAALARPIGCARARRADAASRPVHPRSRRPHAAPGHRPAGRRDGPRRRAAAHRGGGRRRRTAPRARTRPARGARARHGDPGRSGSRRAHGPRGRHGAAEPRGGFRPAHGRGVRARHAGRALGCAGAVRGLRRCRASRWRSSRPSSTPIGSRMRSARCWRIPRLADRVGVGGVDRARVFTWRNAADKVWQLHADL